MTFRIKHENIILVVIAVIAMVIMMLIMFIFPGVPKSVIIGDMSLMTACLFLYVLEKGVGTEVRIEGRQLIIKPLFIAKSIAIDDICDLEIKRNYRTTRSGSEYRVTLTIYLTNDSEVILTDAGGKRSATVFGRQEPLPDDDIPLYQLYQVLYSMLPTE